MTRATKTKPLDSASLSAVNDLDEASDLVAFLGWVASARELDESVRIARLFETGAAQGLPVTMDYDDVVSSGHQWVFTHLSSVLSRARAHLTD